ncbi:MAG: penicillin-binding protein [Desulfuromonas sp.]|uniref:penicillin-binding protein n=1 Tax=Desulfuromonas sp. TaxID=892 RepID=UPI000CCB5870|nr:penicillin-binding protein [Desulfuromonas sp.]PLX81649.1 MAG: penicillin-binding protein [Desulfuromonas sp.]
MDKTEGWVRIRIRLVGVLFVVAFLLVATRAYYIQVHCRDDWQKKAERQHQKVIPLTPQRGTIFDRNSEVMALSVEADSIYLEPSKARAGKVKARDLAAALSLPHKAVAAKLKSEKRFLWLKRQVPPRVSEKVRALKLPGVNFIKEHKRYYPNSKIGAQVVGFTGIDPEGLEGVELKYDSVILGQGGYLVTERDALGRGIGSGEPEIKGGSRGDDLYLTLDKNLQYIAEKELAAGVRKANAKAGTVVVLEPRTGKVLAMASQPDFNPNAFNKYRPRQWRNRALIDTFEPGSTMKIFLLAAALNEGAVRPEELIDCEKGEFRVGGKVIHDHHPYEQLSVADILKVSSNIGSAKIGKILERDRLYSYLTGFGFGAPSGVDLPGETSGLLRKPSRWFEVDLAAISFGQAITVTPLQLALATAAIANGGTLMEPYVVERVVDSYGEVVDRRKPRAVRRVVNEKVARIVREMMVRVTEEGGTGTRGAVTGYRVAGKTGTAQKVDPVTRGYSVDKRVSSFVGMVPAEDPELVVLVVIDEPEGQTYGGVVAAPVFSRIAEQALRHLKVAPNQPGQEDFLPPLPPVTLASRETPPVRIEGQGGEIEGEGTLNMPDCIGMSYRQVLQAMERTGLNIRLNGSGRVVEQLPAPGGQIRYGKEVWVRLQPPA